MALVQNSGHLQPKEELMKTVWPDSHVEEGNLTRNISTLRKLLGEGTDESKYIETVPKRGYRFIAEVRRVADGDSAAPASPREHIRARMVFEETIQDEVLPATTVFAQMAPTVVDVSEDPLSLEESRELAWLIEHPPETKYARSGDVNIAYRVVGNAPLDLVFVMGGFLRILLARAIVCSISVAPGEVLAADPF